MKNKNKEPSKTQNEKKAKVKKLSNKDAKKITGGRGFISFD